jgi:hypothetical protein
MAGVKLTEMSEACAVLIYKSNPGAAYNTRSQDNLLLRIALTAHAHEWSHGLAVTCIELGIIHCEPNQLNATSAECKVSASRPRVGLVRQI